MYGISSAAYPGGRRSGREEHVVEELGGSRGLSVTVDGRGMEWGRGEGGGEEDAEVEKAVDAVGFSCTSTTTIEDETDIGVSPSWLCTW